MHMRQLTTITTGLLALAVTAAHSQTNDPALRGVWSAERYVMRISTRWFVTCSRRTPRASKVVGSAQCRSSKVITTGFVDRRFTLPGASTSLAITLFTWFWRAYRMLLPG